MWFLVVILIFSVAILRFLTTIMEIKGHLLVLGDTIGFIGPKNMGIDIRITLLGASLNKLKWSDFWRSFWIFWWLFWDFWHPSWISKGHAVLLKWFYWILWLWKHGYRHMNCAVRSFSCQLMMILCDFWWSFWFFGGDFELFGSYHGN